MANIVKLDAKQAAEIAAEIAMCEIAGVKVKVKINERNRMGHEVHIFFPPKIDGLERQALEKTLTSFGYQLKTQRGGIEALVTDVDLELLNNLSTKNFKSVYREEFTSLDIPNESQPSQPERKTPAANRPLHSQIRILDAQSKEAGAKLMVEIGKLKILEIRTKIKNAAVQITPAEIDKLHFEALEKALVDYPFKLEEGKSSEIVILNPENLDRTSPDKLRTLYQQALAELTPLYLARKDLIRFFTEEVNRLPKDSEKRMTYSGILWDLNNFKIVSFNREKIIQLCNQFLDEARCSDNPNADKLKSSFSMFNAAPTGVKNMKTLMQNSPHLNFAKQTILGRIDEIESHIKTEGPYTRPGKP